MGEPCSTWLLFSIKPLPTHVLIATMMPETSIKPEATFEPLKAEVSQRELQWQFRYCAHRLLVHWDKLNCMALPCLGLGRLCSNFYLFFLFFYSPIIHLLFLSLNPFFFWIYIFFSSVHAETKCNLCHMSGVWCIYWLNFYLQVESLRWSFLVARL